MATTSFVTSHRRQEGNDVAIIFLHGFSGDAKTTWESFPDFLSKEPCLNKWDIHSIGYSTNMLIPDFIGAGFWSAEPSLQTLADLLRTRLNNEFQGYKRVMLIAHSMGGLIAQRALLDDAELHQRKVHALYLFGTPSQGLTKATPFAFWKRQIRDMANDGDFIRQLRQDWSETFTQNIPPFKFVAVAGACDEFVPRDSSIDLFPRSCCAVVPGDHLDIVKPQSKDDLSVKLIVNLSCDAQTEGTDLWNSARIAKEYRDFHEAVIAFEKNKDNIDQDAAVDYALALEGIGRQDDAIRFLQEYARSTDAKGVLAGRLKRRWLAERIETLGNQSLKLYQEALNESLTDNNFNQAFYHVINIAFMELAYKKNPTAARKAANKALEYCQHCSPPDKWQYATQGEASLILGDYDKAISYYRKALEQQPKPREIISMYQQAIKIAELSNLSEERQLEVDSIFLGQTH